MINELLEVQQNLNGENIDKDSLQRTCFLLARWYKEQGYDHLRTREAIFAWANKYHLRITFSLNSIINTVMADKIKLRGDVDVYINKNDVQQITCRFDSKNAKIIALAILCYAKVVAEDGEWFDMSEAALAKWVDIRRSNVSSYYMKEMVNYGYLDKTKPKKATYTWNRTTHAKRAKLKLHVPIQNVGEYKLVDNDIERLYREVFGGAGGRDGV